MYPEIVRLGPLTIESYGLMLGLAFVAASWLLSFELQRLKLDPDVGSTTTLIAIGCGLVGAKFFYLIDQWQLAVADPMTHILSPAGLAWLGGFVVATPAIWLFTRSRGISFLQLCDAAVPGLMIGYGLARVGCHLSGDGDYGFPTTVPWAMEYSHGTVPPSVAVAAFPDIVRSYGVNGVVPDNTLVHPTPLYEALVSVLSFGWLWSLRKKNLAAGRLFMFYLCLAGVSRFAVEFVRINPRVFVGLTQAQVIAMSLIVTGGGGMWALGAGGRVPGGERTRSQRPSKVRRDR